MSLCSICTASALVFIIDICGSLETTKHYLFDCNRVIYLRQEMMQSISQLCEAILNALSYGVTDLSDATNHHTWVYDKD